MTSVARLPRAFNPVAMRVVAPVDLHRHWSMVRQGLLRCAMKGGGEYLPEDAYHGIKAGTLTLFLIVASGCEIGFAILRREEEPSGVVLFVWALWCERGAGARHEAAITEALRAKAGEVGARRLKMWSGRAGWARRGWREVTRVWEQEV